MGSGSERAADGAVAPIHNRPPRPPLNSSTRCGTHTFQIFVAPGEREIAALFRFGGLNPAGGRRANQKDAGPRRAFRQGQPPPIVPEPGESIREVRQGETQHSRDGGAFRITDTYFPRVPAAVAAALAVERMLLNHGDTGTRSGGWSRGALTPVPRWSRIHKNRGEGTPAPKRS